MLEQFKVSIIIPVYNTEKYIDECIQSVINQTYKNLEIILIDDGSTDSSLHKCQNYQKNDSRIKLLQQKNTGVSTARNNGLALATGDYIVFMDSDDVCELNMIESLITVAINKNSDVVFSKINFLYKDCCNLPKPLTILKSQTKSDVLDIIFSNTPWKETNINGGYLLGKLFTKKILKNVYFDPTLKMCEDELFLVNVLIKNDPHVTLLNKVLYHYRQRASSAVNTLQFKNLESKIKALAITNNKTEQECILQAIIRTVFEFSFSWHTKHIPKTNKDLIIEVLKTNTTTINELFNKRKISSKEYKIIKRIMLFNRIYSIYTLYRSLTTTPHTHTNRYNKIKELFP